MVTDATGNLIESVNFKGTKTSYEYNKAGDKVKQTNLDGSTIEWTYNSNGQINTEKKRVEDTDKTTTYLITKYQYSKAGEVEKQMLNAEIYEKSTKQTSQIKVNSTDITYDELGRVVRKYLTYYNGDTIKHSDTRFLYDLNGNLMKKWVYDETSNTVTNNTVYPFIRSESTYEYDANNRFIREEKTENGMVTIKTYKDDENAEIVQSAIGNTTVFYNENDLAKKIVMPLNEEFNIAYTASELIDKVSGPRLTMDMSYGPNEKMTEIITKKKDSNTVIFAESYLYNGQEQIDNDREGKKSYTYTQEGFLKTVKKGADIITYSYDVNGNILKAVKQDGTVLQENTYNEGNRINTSILLDRERNKYVKKTYTFNVDGSLSKETISEEVSTYTAAKTANVDLVKTFAYAGNNLLKSVTTKRGTTVI
ncbi:hypothetical protein [Aquibacillus kalidii]|uniref:hypothetical protein n=1 Tax=Aquibacillus kalidii TaxID=2762597 RepID=UPI001649210C|nr:hypothetical protein [Aquibacillus kalidii]